MSDQKSLVFTLGLVALVLLLVTVPSRPIRTSEFDAVSFERDGVRHNIAVRSSQSKPHLCAGTGAGAVLEVNALRSENDEEDRVDAVDERRISFSVPCCFRTISDHQLIVPRSIISLYPLRC